MCERDVADVDPEGCAGRWAAVFGGAGDEVADAFVGGVDCVEGAEVVGYGAEDEGWVALPVVNVSLVQYPMTMG